MTSPPRLFVIMAQRAHVAVVIRRGPSDWAHLVLWETDRDAFTDGAWFRGRIFAEKCDLSPDGELLVYAAYKGDRFGTEYTDSWTAVSRPPWLHALAVWPMGTTYGGGGRFVDDRRLIVRGGTKTLPDHPARGLEVVSGPAEHHASTGEVPEAEWSGHDQNGRLVFATNGRIIARTGRDDVELADLTNRTPDPQPPPDWAKLAPGLPRPRGRGATK
jgi:hypothetical protein